MDSELDAVKIVASTDVHDLRIVIQRLARRIRAERSDQDMSDSQMSVLMRLAKEGEQSLKDLASHERVTPPSMNRTINALEEAGYVSRVQSADDLRKVRLSLTAKGEQIVASTRAQRDAWFSQRLAELTPAKRTALDNAMLVLRELSES